MSTRAATVGTLRLGTRRSTLATTQTGLVAEALRRRGHADVRLVEVTTYGDVDRGPLVTIGGTGVFVTALRQALLDGEVDVAVHSLKDLPTALAPGVALAAVPPREDARDVLVARDGLGLAELPAGATVGTGSPRRAGQLHALGLGLQVRPVRGNVDTRLAMVGTGQLDAVVLARAGLARLGRLDAATEVLDPVQMLPAPGQGALAVECRADDEAVRELLHGLDDAESRSAVAAERALLARLEAGCAAPVGAHAVVAEGEGGPEIYLRAVVVAADGSRSVRLSATGPLDDPEGLGRRLAEDLLSEGAGEITASARSSDLGRQTEPHDHSQERHSQ